MARFCALLGAAIILFLASNASASVIIGGDAVSQASADTILDIVIVIDTSGSMTDDIVAIGNVARAAIEELQCPDIDVYIRARFFGINGAVGTVFNENARTYVDGRNGALTPLTNSTEDNAPIVSDLIAWYEFNNDAVGDQQYVKAIVTIGDEGTEDGAPVTQADYTAASAANQAAIANDVLLFSWVTNDPTSALVVPLFELMAIGGTPAAPFTGTFGNTGGRLINNAANNLSPRDELEEILCVAATGGTNHDHGAIPEPATCLIWSLLAASSLAYRSRRRFSFA